MRSSRPGPRAARQLGVRSRVGVAPAGEKLIDTVDSAAVGSPVMSLELYGLIMLSLQMINGEGGLIFTRG